MSMSFTGCTCIIIVVCQRGLSRVLWGAHPTPVTNATSSHTHTSEGIAQRCDTIDRLHVRDLYSPRLRTDAPNAVGFCSEALCARMGSKKTSVCVGVVRCGLALTLIGLM